MKFTRELLGRKNQKGVALLIAIFTTMLITYVVTEIIYDTNVEYVVNSQSISRLKAYYAAKSGLELSLLRIKIFAKLQQNEMVKNLPAAQKKMVNMVWQFPFAWPPMIPTEASGVDKDMINDKIKEAAMDATYVTTISEEGSKIDINDLASPSKGLREITKKLLIQIFENRRQNDEEWARANESLRSEELVNNIIDWVDADMIAINGGDERQNYAELQAEKPLPPNRSFRTVDELRMVAGMTEEIFAMLKDRVTVYGMKAINPNFASAEVLKALDPSINDEVIAKIMERRNDEEQEPFSNEADFWQYVNTTAKGNVSEEVQKSIPMVFNEVYNFRIKSVGEFAKSTREIEAVVFDFSSVGTAVAQRLHNEATEAAGGKPPDDKSKSQQNNKKSNEQLPKGPPRIVYLIDR